MSIEIFLKYIETHTISQLPRDNSDLLKFRIWDKGQSFINLKGWCLYLMDQSFIQSSHMLNKLYSFFNTPEFLKEFGSHIA